MHCGWVDYHFAFSAVPRCRILRNGRRCSLDATSARVWIEQQSDEHQSLATERGTVKFEQAATIKSWYGGSIR